jgi:DNA/RNA-binding domain of Phe-tRNA-synthetase-like protein
VDELDPQEGWVAPSVAEEFPELRLWWLPIDCRDGKSTPALKWRLKSLSGRTRGAQAMQLRNRPIPHAYRVFFRHIGLDPDVDRIPAEQLIIDRLMHGEYKSHGLVSDALRIAAVETEIPMWAVDADTLQGELQIRGAYEREELDPGNPAVPWLPEGRLVVADPHGPIAVLFSDVAAPRAVSRSTTRLVIFTIQVAGVPSIYVSEALWTVFDLLEMANDD